MTREEFTDKVETARRDFRPTVSPACADFVSTMLREQGGLTSLPHITYVPNFLNYFKTTTEPLPGDLIIFDQTYDAVKPDGIGPEDDMTHVGIVDRALNNKTNFFFHFSNSAGRALWANWTDAYWAAIPKRFLRVDFGVEEAKSIKKLAKIFVNNGKASLIFDGKEYKIKNLEMEIEHE